MTLHTLELRVDDENLWWAIQRRKLEYKERFGCKNWLQVLAKWANVPIESELSEDDKRTYEILDKLKDYNLQDSDLSKKLQGKAQHQQALRDLASKRGQLIELVNDPDLSESRHAQCLDMLALLDSVIESEGQNK